jgi:hypothetical protein
VPGFDAKDLADAALIRSGRFEKRLCGAFEMPYSHYLGTVWSYWMILVKVAVEPYHGHYKKTPQGLLKMYTGSASALEGFGASLFGDDFLAAGPIEEVVKRLPSLAAYDQVAKADHQNTACLPARLPACLPN